MHSFIRGSIEKLNEFVQRVSPEVIIPSVYNDGPDSAAAMAIKLTAAQMCNKRLVGYRLSRGCTKRHRLNHHQSDAFGPSSCSSLF
ncbi:hypothetical protein YC2023_101124 [Brassica napus]